MPKGDDGKMKTAPTNFVEVCLTLFPRSQGHRLTPSQTYKAMEKLLKTGKTKAIGISNFSKAEIERLLKETSVVPAAHQVEMHPWLQQKELDALHKKNNIHTTQYSPFGNQNEIYGSDLGKLMDDPVLVEIGKKYKKNGAQIALGESPESNR